MQKIISAAQMREIDRLTSERFALPSLLLMEQAANAVVTEIDKRFPARYGTLRRAFVLCGQGNNGGDGACVARILWMRGWQVCVVLIGDVGQTHGDALVNFTALQNLTRIECSEDDQSRVAEQNYHAEHSHRQLATLTFDECREAAELASHFTRTHECDVVIDALFGTGLTRPLSGIHAASVDLINQIRDSSEFSVTPDSNKKNAPFVVAVDIPSGVYSDDPNSKSNSVRAHSTVTFTAPKLANVLPPASRTSGKLIIAPIGSPQILIDEADSNTFLTEESDAQKWLRRTRYLPGSYKNTHGHALVIAGSKQFSGAAVLAAHATMRAGAGLVTLATSASALPSIAARLPPEVMTVALEETDEGAISDLAFAQIESLMTRVQIVAIGCGLSSHDERTKLFVRRVIEKCDKTLIIDAGGLNAIAPLDETIKSTNVRPLVLTPHEGEMRRLLGLQNNEAFPDRVRVAREFASKHNLILVLKGERTLVAAPDGRVAINPTGNAGLGTAGAGDTLTGIIAGFNAQASAEFNQTSSVLDQKSDMSVRDKQRRTNESPDADFALINSVFDATVAAVYVGGLAGDLAARALGMRTMLASDVREHLGRAVCALDPEGEMP